MSGWDKLIEKVDDLIDRVNPLLPPRYEPIDWKVTTAARWHRVGRFGSLYPVKNPHEIRLQDLKGIDDQKLIVDKNIRQFVNSYPANNVLLTGSKGTGKSSLVKAMLVRYSKQGLRVIEVEKDDLHELQLIIDQIAPQPYRFIIYCDDLSFSAEEGGYKALKVALDGSIATCSENILIFATSNRRHLLPELMSENLETRYVGTEVHPGETTEEKISLSERFGLWVNFDSFDQDTYLRIVEHWIGLLSNGSIVFDEGVSRLSLQWALERGSRSGRVAYHFSRDYIGSQMLNRGAKPRAKKTAK